MASSFAVLKRPPISVLSAASSASAASRSIFTSSKLADSIDDDVRPQNKVKGVTGITYLTTSFGSPAGKKPIVVELEKGKTYSWCNCGYSNRQPFCDGTHKIMGQTLMRPVRFEAQKSGPHVLCNCKQTTHRPLCDGSHKRLPPGPVEAQQNLHPIVAFEQIDPQAHVTTGTARKLGLKERDGFFK